MRLRLAVWAKIRTAMEQPQGRWAGAACKSGKKIIGDALDILTTQDWLKAMHDQNTGDRPKTRYLLNPGLIGCNRFRPSILPRI